MTPTTSANPLRDGVQNTRPMPQPCSLVIFGASGDLTLRKLLPALYNIALDGELPPALAVVGFARREKTDDSFRAEMLDGIRKFSRQSYNENVWDAFAKNLFYHRSEFTDPEGFRSLAQRLDAIDTARGTRGNRLFYFSVAPDQFPIILEQIRSAGLHHPVPGGWTRVIVEKPFGTDLPSAQALNTQVSQVFHESDTYRIDHYLGKETAQNIMVLRFANAIFEPLWNSRYIDHVQITAGETLGVEGRAGYYDHSGAIRDMVQNHLMQLLSLIAMEPPTDLSADSIRDEKVKVIRSLRRLQPAQVAQNVIRGQYDKGFINGAEVPAYLEAERVAPGSKTDTYVALRLNIDNWRWENVPFYIRTGKRLPKSGTEISIHFKNPPRVLFNADPDPAAPAASGNVLVVRIQPDEGISLRMQAKQPGASVRIDPVKMDFSYGSSFGKASPEAYERLLLDAMSGDATLFARRDEVEQAWTFVDDIINAWHDDSLAIPVHPYPCGSWGPTAADELLEADGRSWRRL